MVLLKPITATNICQASWSQRSGKLLEFEKSVILLKFSLKYQSRENYEAEPVGFTPKARFHLESYLQIYFYFQCNIAI